MTAALPPSQIPETPQTVPPVQETPKKNKRIDITIFILVIMVGLCLTYLFYFSHSAEPKRQQLPVKPQPTSLPTKIIRPTTEELLNAREQLSVLQVGAFTFTFPPKYLYPVQVGGYYYNDFDPEPIAVSTTQIETDSTSNCAQINGVHLFGATRYYPDENSGDSPLFWVKSWSENKIDFKDQEGNEVPEFRAEYEEYLRGLASLDSYAANQTIFQDVLSGNNAFSDSLMLGCAGGWWHPLLVTKVNQDRFDSVYYVEVNSGNGDLEAPPHRSLFVHDGDAWLIVSEQQRYDESQDWSQCFPLEYANNEKLKCVERVWREKYRNAAENQAWITSMLAMITIQ